MEREPGGAAYLPFAQGFVSDVTSTSSGPSDTALDDLVRREYAQRLTEMSLFGVRTFTTHIETAARDWMLKLST